MSDLKGLSGGSFSTQSLSGSDLQRFARLKEHPPQQAAQKAQLKAQLLAQLDQLDARLAALQQRSAEDFGMPAPYMTATFCSTKPWLTSLQNM